MDSDDSYESTSEVIHSSDSVMSTSNSQDSIKRDSIELPELYNSTFSRPESKVLNSTEHQSAILPRQFNELNNYVYALKQERIDLLEQITHLYSSLETKESELVEFMHSYELKVNDVAEYMLEVQVLLGQLTALFNDHMSQQQRASGGTLSFKPALPTDVELELVDDDNETSFDPENGDWNKRGRALLQALSASVATASARNKQATLPRSSAVAQEGEECLTFGTCKTSRNQHEKLQCPLTCTQSMGQEGLQETVIPSSSTADLEYTVSRLPPWFWTVNHVVYWLTMYACLPGGCIDSARRNQVDGKMLTSLASNKIDKLLCLNDAGLRRKLHLILEDLRVHGPPGVSRCPGPSHIRPHWVCNVWLRRHIGLSQLVPVFALRRVDGRVLASLAIYKPPPGGCGVPLTNPYLPDRNYSAELSAALTSQATTSSECHSVNGVPSTSGTWRGASRKELHRILLGIGRDSIGSVIGDVASGADLSTDFKHLIGKREACSLRCGIELLRRFNFDVDLLEECRNSESSEDPNLLLWSNERVATWLTSLGLKDFVEGIDGTGLHGAYMVLDEAFDTAQLMKHLHIPANVASIHQLNNHLRKLLDPARIREGISLKKRGIFRIRSTRKPGIGAHITISNTLGTKPSLPESCITPETPLSHTSCSLTDHSRMNLNVIDETVPLRQLDVFKCEELKTGADENLKTHSLTKSVNKFSENEIKLSNESDSDGVLNNHLGKLCFRGQSALQVSLPTTHLSRDLQTRLPPPTEDGDDRATLVRKPSNMSANPSSQPENYQIPTKFAKGSPAAVMIHPSQSTRTTPVKRVVKASEAPVVDPFNPNEIRKRIVLGQNLRSSNYLASKSSTASRSAFPQPLTKPGATDSNEECVSTPRITDWQLTNDPRRDNHPVAYQQQKTDLEGRASGGLAISSN